MNLVKLYSHPATGVIMLWNAIGIIVVPVVPMLNLTNFDFYLFVGLAMTWLCTCVYGMLVDEADKKDTYQRGLNRILDNDKFTPDEKAKRAEMYRKMF